METISKSELASKYKVSTKTFGRWLKRAGIETGKSKLLLPATVERIRKEFGEP